MGDEETLFSQKLAGDDISLVIGAPGPYTLKRAVSIFEKASLHRAKDAAKEGPGGDGAIFEYGPRSGYKPFLKELAKFLERGYNSPVKPLELLLTPGATVGLWLAATALLPPGRGVVFMECPSSFIATPISAKTASLW